jgi:hypothetical protein
LREEIEGDPIQYTDDPVEPGNLDYSPKIHSYAPSPEGYIHQLIVVSVESSGHILGDGFLYGDETPIPQEKHPMIKGQIKSP